MCVAQFGIVQLLSRFREGSWLGPMTTTTTTTTTKLKKKTALERELSDIPILSTAIFVAGRGWLGPTVPERSGADGVGSDWIGAVRTAAPEFVVLFLLLLSHVIDWSAAIGGETSRTTLRCTPSGQLTISP